MSGGTLKNIERATKQTLAEAVIPSPRDVSKHRLAERLAPGSRSDRARPSRALPRADRRVRHRARVSIPARARRCARRHDASATTARAPRPRKRSSPPRSYCGSDDRRERPRARAARRSQTEKWIHLLQDRRGPHPWRTSPRHRRSDHRRGRSERQGHRQDPDLPRTSPWCRSAAPSRPNRWTGSRAPRSAAVSCASARITDRAEARARAGTAIVRSVVTTAGAAPTRSAAPSAADEG